MSRKLVAVCIVLALASVSFADVLIGDWEDSDDGWVCDGVYPGQSVGVTLHTYSGGFDISQNYWSVEKTGLTVADFAGAKKLQMDVTMIATEWEVYWNWTKVDKIAVQSDATSSGWQEFLPTAIDRTTGLPCALDWGAWNGDMYKTYTWDLTGLDLTGATYVDLHVAFQNTSVATGFFYVDNAWIRVPEPATMGLLGLGGLALIRRKK